MIHKKSDRKDNEQILPPLIPRISPISVDMASRLGAHSGIIKSIMPNRNSGTGIYRYKPVEPFILLQNASGKVEDTLI